MTNRVDVPVDAEADAVVTFAQGGSSVRWCRVCHAAPQHRATGRCTTCYRYRLRNGVDRPEHLIVAHNRRRGEREMLRRWGWAS